MRRILVLLATMAAAVLVASGVAVAAVLTFSNTSEILIRDASARDVPRPAEPYPSEISVSGFSGPIRDVNLILKGFRHTYPDDVGVLLVGPEGQTALLMSDVGGGGVGNQVFGVRVVLDDEATTSLPDNDADGQITSGTYKPTQGTVNSDGEKPVPADFPLPAPAGPYGADLSVFDGTDPNGTWQLYVVDDTDLDRGKFNKGWSLRIKAAVL
jgi:subtilisin-like proprotein convertase family protein